MTQTTETISLEGSPHVAPFVSAPIIIQDNNSFRSARIADGLRKYGSTAPFVSVTTSTSLTAAFRKHRPDLVVVSTDYPDALRNIKNLLSTFSAAKVVLISSSRHAMTDHDALLAGGMCHLQWEQGEDTIARVLTGITVKSFSNETPSEATRITSPRILLTTRERQVLLCMSNGMTNGEIARKLYLSEDTVKTHARRMYRKLGVTDRAGAVGIGLRTAQIV